MATWVYKCLTCDNTFEVWKHGLSKPKNIKCPRCGEAKVKNIIKGPKVYWRFTGV